RRRDEHAAPVLEGVAARDLERIEPESLRGGELRGDGMSGRLLRGHVVLRGRAHPVASAGGSGGSSRASRLLRRRSNRSETPAAPKYRTTRMPASSSIEVTS